MAGNEAVSALAWEGHYVALASSRGSLGVWDLRKVTRILQMQLLPTPPCIVLTALIANSAHDCRKACRCGGLQATGTLCQRLHLLGTGS